MPIEQAIPITQKAFDEFLEAAFAYGANRKRFLFLCDPMKWYEPTDDQLINFQPRPADYVSVKQLAREEMD